MYLPASFEDQPYGRVQYFAKVVVERPWKGAIEISRHFTVLGMLDLNTDADAKVRCGCFFCTPHSFLAPTTFGAEYRLPLIFWPKLTLQRGLSAIAELYLSLL